jgi:hypothetical protein
MKKIILNTLAGLIILVFLLIPIAYSIYPKPGIIIQATIVLAGAGAVAWAIGSMINRK